MLSDEEKKLKKKIRDKTRYENDPEFRLKKINQAKEYQRRKRQATRKVTFTYIDKDILKGV